MSKKLWLSGKGVPPTHTLKEIFFADLHDLGYKRKKIKKVWKWPNFGQTPHFALFFFRVRTSLTLNFATSAGAMNRFKPTKVAKFKVHDCRSYKLISGATVLFQSVRILPWVIDGRSIHYHLSKTDIDVWIISLASYILVIKHKTKEKIHLSNQKHKVQREPTISKIFFFDFLSRGCKCKCS